MSLPLLPGYILNPNVGKQDFNKPQTFSFENKLPVEKDKYFKGLRINSNASDALKQKSGKPAWLAFDKYVLCFDAFFEEDIPKVSQLETHRFRKCKIYYFLEDDTMQIVEPTKRNSGIPQGVLVRRHRFRKPESQIDSESEYYELEDLNVAITLDIHGRLYKITSCDKFTRSFLSEAGIRVNDPVSEPVDPYQEHRKLLEDTTAYNKRREKKDTLGQFLNFNPHALRFYCLWDDTHNMYGMKRRMVLHYYLDDDTVEIIEERGKNSGQCDTKTFLKRAKLPKQFERLPEPGELTGATVLNTSGIRGNERYYTLDTNPAGGLKVNYYTDRDLDLGIFINVWGRSFFLYDCDDFTKTFYKLKYDKDLVPCPIADEVNAAPKVEIFPRNVFGSPEDTIQNCFSLQPKPPSKDLIKFYVNDKYGWDSKQLTFAACILTDEPIKKSRRFVITYYLSDDTIQINEPRQDNTGIEEGKLVDRTKIEKPGSEKAVVPFYYTEKDFFVGNVLRIRGDDFLLTSADEYTYEYMEKNPHQFEHSNVWEIMKKAKQWLSEKHELLKLYFQSVDEGSTGFVPFDVFRKTIYDSIPEKVPEQDIITLGRHYADLECTDLKWEEIIEMVQTELRKKNYNDFDNLLLALKEYDTENKGTFNAEDMYLHLISCRVPLPKDLLKCFLYTFPSSPDSIEYMKVINALNYMDNPVPLASPAPKVNDINWLKKKTAKCLERINYMAFIKDLCDAKK